MLCCSTIRYSGSKLSLMQIIAMSYIVLLAD